MQIDLAITIMRDAHEGQKGTTQNPDEPFSQHPARVTQMVMDNMGHSCFKDDAAVVAALHDVVEDTKVTLDSLIRMGLTDTQAKALYVVTRRDGQSYVEHVLECLENPIARSVKIYDLVDKIPSTKGSLHDKYVLAFYILTGHTEWSRFIS